MYKIQIFINCSNICIYTNSQCSQNRWDDMLTKCRLFYISKEEILPSFWWKCLMTSSLNKFELQARDGQCVLLFTKKKLNPKRRRSFNRQSAFWEASVLLRHHTVGGLFSLNLPSHHREGWIHVCVCAVYVCRLKSGPKAGGRVTSHYQIPLQIIRENSSVFILQSLTLIEMIGSKGTGNTELLLLWLRWSR